MAKRTSPPENLIYLADRTAKVLYAVLRLQHDARHELPGATVKRVAKYTAVNESDVREVLNDLRDAGYVTATAAKGDALSRLEDSHLVYEINVQSGITCRDTAVLLLELVNTTRVQEPKDREGKVDARAFVDKLNESKKLEYLTDGDIFGTPMYKGKIAELVEAGRHLERVSEKYIRLRAKVYMEQHYLRILRDQPDLDELASYEVQPAPPHKTASSEVQADSRTGDNTQIAG